MTIDPTFTADTEVRLLKIEEALTELWGMLRMVMNREQFNRLNVIRQAEMTQLSERLDTAETDVATLKSRYNDLF